MRSYLYHFWPYFLSALTLLGIYVGDIFCAAGIGIIFILHPLLDNLLTKFFGDQKQSIEKVSNFSIYFWPLYQTIFLCVSIYLLVNQSSIIYMSLGIISLGIINGGFGITIAHELIHRTKKWERGLGVWILSLVNFSVFRIEHVFGHHRNVATPLDPASAQKGENIYLFIPKAIFGVFKGAKKFEHKRVSRLKPRPVNFIYNRFYQYMAISLAISTLIYAAFGITALYIFIAQSLIAVSLLEMVDYIEHYGLQRKRLENGKYEPVGPQHSWDTNFFMTNTSLYNLGKHAHHHRVASLPFQHLKSTEGAKNYPFGYSSAVILALMPPLWRKVVDPLLD